MNGDTAAWCLLSGVACTPAGPMLASGFDTTLGDTVVITFACFIWGFGYFYLLNHAWGVSQ